MDYKDVEGKLENTYSYHDYDFSWLYNDGYLDGLKAGQENNTPEFRNYEISALRDLNSELKREKVFKKSIAKI